MEQQLASFVTIIDVFIIFVVFISALIGSIRGGTKEILSVFAWLGSILLAIAAFQHAKEISRKFISHGLIADFVAASALFILFLSLLSIFSYVCSNFVKKSILSNADRCIGLIFGVARGVVFLSVLDIGINQWFITADSQLFWLEQSRLRPYVMKTANFAILMLPHKIQDEIVSRMSQLNKDNIMKFMANSVLNSGPIKVEASKEPSGIDLFIEDDGVKVENADEARALATLTPKPPTEVSGSHVIKKTEKEKLDMDRVLDQELSGSVEEELGQ